MKPCRKCGNRSYRIDYYRQTGAEAKKQTCYCDSYPYPHRRGSKDCKHRDLMLRVNTALREEGLLVETLPKRKSYD